MKGAGAQARIVLIDVRCIGHQGGGFSTYQRGLVRGLAEAGEMEGVEPVFLAAPAGTELIRSAWMSLGLAAPRVVGTELPFLHPREWIEIPTLLRDVRADLFHSTTFMSVPAALMPCPWVVTIHDLNHLRFGGLGQKLYYSRLLRPFARRAARIFTVSEFSRGELAAWLGFEADRIGIAWNALEPDLLKPLADAAVSEVLGERGLERGRYVLSLSNPKPHKNLGTLVEGYKRYRSAAASSGRSPLELALTVGTELNSQAGVRCLGALEPLEVRALVRGAAALVFPSIYEGFGLPPVEAIVQGVPVACSEIRPHREGLLGVDAASLAWVPDPLDPESWEQALRKISEGGLAAPSPETSHALSQRFSTARLGATMAACYRDVLTGERRD